MKQKNRPNRNFGLALLLLIIALGIWILLLTEPLTITAQSYNNTSLVNTTVNITNSAPLVESVTLQSPINLQAYDNVTVGCNTTVFDYDNDTLTVNATLYINGSVTLNDPEDGNNLYRNSSCSATTNQDRRMNYTCTFDVEYYANASSDWLCQVTVKDDSDANTSNRSTTSTLNTLVAIKLPSLLDYGDLAVNQISADTIANITNAGNRHANISVEGYADTPNDGLAFNCSFGSIDISYERYNTSSGSGYSDMTQLTINTNQIENNFYVPQRVNETKESTNATYWKVQIPVGAGGICTGKILFTAVDRGIQASP